MLLMLTFLASSNTEINWPFSHHCQCFDISCESNCNFFFLFLFLDPTNPICYSRKAFAASDRPTLPQHWFSQHFFADISCFYWWYYSSWSFKESVFPTWASRLTNKFKWVSTSTSKYVRKIKINYCQAQ